MTVAAWLLFLSGVGIGVVLSILLTAPAYRKQAASIRKLIAESDANIAETARIKQRFEEWHKRQALPEALQQVVDSLFVNGSGEQAARLVLTSKDGRDLGGWAKGPILDRLMAATHKQQTEALPPLPKGWHHDTGSGWEAWSTDNQRITVNHGGVWLDSDAGASPVRVPDLILVLRHAERAHQRLKVGA